MAVGLKLPSVPEGGRLDASAVLSCTAQEMHVSSVAMQTQCAGEDGLQSFGLIRAKNFKEHVAGMANHAQQVPHLLERRDQRAQGPTDGSVEGRGGDMIQGEGTGGGLGWAGPATKHGL
jgi:hypothetical protein